MTYRLTSIYSYLNGLETYLRGDLEQFHNICANAEVEENLNLSQVKSTETSSLSSTTTTQTTSPTGGPQFQQTSIYYRCTIPVTLALFATIDFLGSLIGSHNNLKSTEQNFNEFFAKSNLKPTTTQINVLREVFRTGLVHLYFPKLEFGVSYHSSNKTKDIIYRDSVGMVILNVNRLEEIVLTTLKDIKDDSSLYPHMESRYQIHQVQNQRHMHYIPQLGI